MAVIERDETVEPGLRAVKGSRPMNIRRVFRACSRAVLFVTISVALSCGAGGGDIAATGGMSGTGISQGSVSAFGSIFVNGTEWDVSTASIEIDGSPANETDLRLGMVVQITGTFSADGLSGTAYSVFFDDSIEGPIASDPVETTPGGPERTFEVLGTTVLMSQQSTAFENGASFLGLMANDVVEVSGFLDAGGMIRATRIKAMGQFPANSNADLEDIVSNLTKNQDGSGEFNLGPILIHYLASTTFDDLTRDSLADGDFVEAKGTLQETGDILVADQIELRTAGLGTGDLEDAEAEGIVTNFVSIADFMVAGTPVDASAATFDPPGFVLADGELVEVDGRLENGVLIADEVESEDEQEALEDVHIEANVSAVDLVARELTILGVTVVVDGKTRLEDDRDEEPNFGFDDIVVGDWLEIHGIQTDPGTPDTVLALDVSRDDPETDVRLEGPVDAFDINMPSLTILGQEIPLDPIVTKYFDDMEVERTEDEFFRNPGYVMLGDIVQAVDLSAVDLDVLGESDEVSIED